LERNLRAGHGDDYLYDSGVNGNTFVYRSGDGNDAYEVSAPTASTDTLFLADINPDGISLSRDDNNVIVKVLATNEKITIWSQFASANDGISQIRFENGTIWDRNTIADIASSSSPYQVILGTGDRTVYGDRKAHAYVYSSISGNDQIYDGTSKSKLVLSDIASTQVSLLRVGRSDDLTITYTPTGKHLTVGGEFSQGYGVMQTITFSDGVSWTQDQIEQILLGQGTVASGGSIYGFSGRNDTIVAGTGNKYLNGLSGSNTYVYSSIGGNDVIDDEGRDSTVVFSDISSGGVALSRQYDSNDLKIINTATGMTVTVKGAFFSWNSIQAVNFSDSASWTMAQIKQMLLDQASAANGGSIYGYGGSNDIIVAGLDDKYLNGGGGFDTYVYSSAGGNDVVDDDSGTLVMQDVASTGVTMSRPNGGNALVITIVATGKTVTLNNEFNSHNEGLTVKFADNVSWNKSDDLLIGGSGNSAPTNATLSGGTAEITPLGQSSAFFDMDGSPGREHTAWVSSGDGILAIDLGGDGAAGPDGVISQTNEIVFSNWVSGAMSDMAALRTVFDTKRNGALDRGDARWSEFRVWQDADGDGISQPGEVKTLDAIGIATIDLDTTGPSQTFAAGSAISGLSNFVWKDGDIGTAADVPLAYHFNHSEHGRDIASAFHFATDTPDFGSPGLTDETIPGGHPFVERGFPTARLTGPPPPKVPTPGCPPGSRCRGPSRKPMSRLSITIGISCDPRASRLKRSNQPGMTNG